MQAARTRDLSALHKEARSTHEDVAAKSVAAAIENDKLSRPKLVVNTDTDQVFTEANGVIGGQMSRQNKTTSAAARAADAAKIDKEIFELSRPEIGEGIFDASAGGPAKRIRTLA